MTRPSSAPDQRADDRTAHQDERPSVAILTLGCKLNLADSEGMARRMRDAGWSVAERARGAEAVIVNTCSVTHVADAKARHLVRRARRDAAPGAAIAVTGCMLETAPAEVIDGLGADLVFKQPQQEALTSRLIELRPAAPSAPMEPGVARPFVVRPGSPRTAAASQPPARAFRTRAFVSAQEGCNDVCAFCIVPKTRGRERSKSAEAVVAEVRAREAEGAQEVVITGTQLGAWGRGRSSASDEPDRGLYPLLRALLAETRVPRIRMSSVQPQDLSAEMIGLWADPRLCRHFHLALQSGSESVLRRMRRRYSARQYRDAVEALRRAVPGVAITTDVIAGFPGETEAEFQETYEFCGEMRFAGMHVFPYSQRSGTVAAKMPEQAQEPVKKERVRRLIALGEKMAAEFRQAHTGTSIHVLWESSRPSPRGLIWEGLTDTYVRVFAGSGPDAHLENRITRVTITEVIEGGVRGRL
jgi:threonylcarbamoyladenosine tRNA methylthiotransferase MtaB